MNSQRIKINQACDKIEDAILELEKEDRTWYLRHSGFKYSIKEIVDNRKRIARDIALMRVALTSLNKIFASN